MYKESYDNSQYSTIFSQNCSSDPKILQTLGISRACMDTNFEWSLLNATKPQ